MVARRPTRILSFAAAALLLLTIPNCVDGAKKEPEVLPSTDVAKAEAAAKEHAALLGKLFPFASQLFRREGGLSFRQVFRDVTGMVDKRDFVTFAALGWGLVPVTQSVYELYANVTGRNLDVVDDDLEGRDDKLNDQQETKNKTSMLGKLKNKYVSSIEGNKLRGTPNLEVSKNEKRKMSPFRNTVLFHVVDHISQASKIAFSVIWVDCLSLFSRMMGYNPWNIFDRASRIFSTVMYSVWITFRIKIFKRNMLEKTFGDMGKMEVVDNLSDGIFYLAWTLYMLNYFRVETGIAVMSLFSIGATGTLVLGLASKDIASQVLSGIFLHMSNKMFEGDTVRFSDGTSGKIENMGWFETYIRNSDELVVAYPNSQLSGQRIYNLSRTPRSQVKQDLRVSYDDAAKIPALLENIKEEIKKDCPKLITDGSRPFRAHWRNWEDDHLQVVVDCHFMITPTGGEYWDNRQTVLQAIANAAKKTGIQFEKMIH